MSYVSNRPGPASGGFVVSVSAGANITITGTATNPIVNFAGTMTYNNAATTPYVVPITAEFISVDCSGGPITVQLPNAPVTGYFFVIKDRTGNAASNNITVTTVGGVKLIDGATSAVIATNYESLNVLYNGTNYETY